MQQLSAWVGLTILEAAHLISAIFGGLILVRRRWVILLSVAGLNSTLYLAHFWFRVALLHSWWGSQLALWTVVSMVTLAGALWSWRRYRKAAPEEQVTALDPRRGEKIILWTLSLAGLASVGYCLLRGTLFHSPWKELLLIWTAAWIGTLSMWCLRFRAARRVALPTEGIMLWALVFACAGLGATTVQRKPAIICETLASGPELLSDTPFLHLSVAWSFEAEDNGTFTSVPLVTADRVYVAAAHQKGFTRTFGTVYCLERPTGKLVWTFDDEERMKPVSISSPCLADGRLFIGEGFHEDSLCKLYCLKADTGEKIWEFQTRSFDAPARRSHIESSPCVVNGKVYFGAGDDGVYCLDARRGKELWHFENIHVDTSPAVVKARLFAGTAYGTTNEAFCLDANTGKPLWRTGVDLPVWGAPAVADDQVVFGLGNGDYLKSADQPAGAVLCLDATSGRRWWRCDVADAVLAKPALDRDHVYFGSRDRHCYCVARRQGTVCWKQDLDSPVVAAPTVGGARVYATTSNGQIYCLKTVNGAVQWSFDVGRHAAKKAQLFAAPVAAGGRLYLSCGLDDQSTSAAVLYCLTGS